jgi:hypothetical protein
MTGGSGAGTIGGCGAAAGARAIATTGVSVGAVAGGAAVAIVISGAG